MKIGVISDIHDRIDHLELVMKEIALSGCQSIIFLGDLEEPSTLLELIRLAGDLPLHFILGNNETELEKIHFIAEQHDKVTFYGREGSKIIGGLRIAMAHYPKALEKFVNSGNCDVALYGHTHKATSLKHGPCIIGNPGEIQGRTGQIGYGILDTEEASFTLHRLSFA